MTETFRAILFSLILTAGIVAPIAAGSFEGGGAADKNAAYENFLRLVHPLAEKDGARTQDDLGFIYVYGKNKRIAQHRDEALKPSGGAAFQDYAAAQISGLFALLIAIIIGARANRPASITVALLVAALVLIHIFIVQGFARDWFSPYLVAGLFAFIPGRYTLDQISDWTRGGVLAAVWSPFTYALLHANVPHLVGNCVPLYVFGRSVAWRIGSWRFLWFFFVSSAAGALLHLAFHWGQPTPLIGASAGVFGIMAATFRFVPRTQDRMKALFWPEEQVRHVPVVTLAEILTERRSLVYALICILIAPLGLIAHFIGTSGNVAVAGHLGGFAFGLFGFGLFDRHWPETAPVVAAAEPGEAKKSESTALQLLRIGFILLMMMGILGGLSYYLGALSRLLGSG